MISVFSVNLGPCFNSLYIGAALSQDALSSSTLTAVRTGTHRAQLITKEVNMKLSNMVTFALLGAATAAPTSTLDQKSTGSIAKRTSITETCNIGYASTNGGTTGGEGGSTATVSTLTQFTKAAESSSKFNIDVKGSISGSAKVRVAADKTIVGQKGSKITGAGLYIKGFSNVIVRNLAISKVKEAYGDAIGIESSTNVWIDHVDVSSDMSSGKDYYDGLIDITRDSDWITIFNSDKGKLHVTYANNDWNNVNLRNPSMRFGTVHIYNNSYNRVGSTGVNTRMSARVHVESSVFENSSKKVILFADFSQTGYATVSDMSYGRGENTAPKGDFGSSKIPYSFLLYGKANVKSKVLGTAGQTLSL
ncbi:pectate lyase B [Colletotrichum paranaense]|uniref:Pectate lyase B n=2 Tax=Colletotrichum acutatum species complex TaxID=2707335 RepID=A0ABQ9RV81_9PEZI|nr:pectate lyase B [Colletotrichum paranaense]KAK1515411.1 pectate lyase B [Colletotrichum paranaense]